MTMLPGQIQALEPMPRIEGPVDEYLKWITLQILEPEVKLRDQWCDARDHCRNDEDRRKVDERFRNRLEQHRQATASLVEARDSIVKQLVSIYATAPPFMVIPNE